MDMKKFIDAELVNLQKELYGTIGGSKGIGGISPSPSPGVDIGDVVGNGGENGEPGVVTPTDVTGKGLEELQKVLAVLNASYQRLKAAITNAFLGTKPGETGYVAPPAAPGGGGIIPKAINSIGSALGLGGQKAGAGAGLEVNVFEKLLLERDFYKNKSDTYETNHKAIIETEKKKAKENFTSRIDKAIADGRMKPESRKALEENYEKLAALGNLMNFEGKAVSIADFLLSRIEGNTSLFKPTLNHESVAQIQFESQSVDLNSENGQEAFYVLAVKEMRELAKADPNCKNPYEKYEEAREVVREKFVTTKE